MLLYGRKSGKKHKLLRWRMLGHMKTHHIKSAQVSLKQEKEWYTPEELFPDHHAGDAIRGLRYRENLTQKQLAEKIGINAQNLSHREHGRRPVDKEAFTQDTSFLVYRKKSTPKIFVADKR